VQGDLKPLTLEAVAEARAKWKAAGIKSYDYWPVCYGFIVATRIKHFRVIVRRGKAVNASHWSNGGLVYKAWTIDETFDELQRTAEDRLAGRHSGYYDVFFHPTLGYPVEVSSGVPDLADSDGGCTVREFRTRWP
jgi:hypothetical protein